MIPEPEDILNRARHARQDPEMAVLEGFHALKHAMRFGGEVECILALAPDSILELARDLAPDLVPRLQGSVEAVPEDVFRRLAPVPPATGVIALARRPGQSLESLRGPERSGPLILLERPTHHGNVGAVVRVAAAAGAAGVITVGDLDPWHPASLRGGAGLQFALPVLAVEEAPELAGTWVALDPEGDTPHQMLEHGDLDEDLVFCFGSERTGLTSRLRDRADLAVRLPMREGVSSLNLATSVAVVLYTLALRSS